MKVKSINILDSTDIVGKVTKGAMSKITPYLGKATGFRVGDQPLILQYPANRESVEDSIAYEGLSDSLYKSSLLFSAYDWKGRTHDELSGWKRKIGFNLDGFGRSQGYSSMLKANILLPRSDTDVDTYGHQFNTVEDSLITRGDGSLAKSIGVAISTSIFSVLDRTTKGMFADQGESIGPPTRSTYKGADHRTKTFTWTFAPYSVDDMAQLLMILKTFIFYSHGISGSSEIVEGLFRDAINAYRQVIGSLAFGDGVHKDDITIAENALSYFKDVRVQSNPTMWFVRNFTTQKQGTYDNNLFGPANIVNININRTPDGRFNGLAMNPDLPSSLTLEITLREALANTRATLI